MTARGSCLPLSLIACLVVCAVLTVQLGGLAGTGRRLTASAGSDEYVEQLHKTISMLQGKVASLEKQLSGKASASQSAVLPIPNPVQHQAPEHPTPTNTTTTLHPPSVKKAAMAEKSIAKMVGLDASSLLSLSMFTDWSNKAGGSQKNKGKSTITTSTTTTTTTKTSSSSSSATTSTSQPPLPETPPPPSRQTQSPPLYQNSAITGLEHLPFVVGMNPQLEAVSGPRGSYSMNKASDYQGPFFYMYDLPEEFWWRWPNPGTDCSENGYVGHEHAVLSGLGPPVLPEEGLFLTWHFSLFSSLFNRIKRSKRRTLDPEKASMFIIPYDLGLDGYLDARTCKNSRRCTAGLPQKLQSILLQQPYFYRHMGADHSVLWSLGQYHPWPHNGCDLFMKEFCARCSFTCYWMDPQKAENRFVSVPFPSGYHWWDGIKSLPWQWDAERARNRTLTAVYVGSTQTLNPAHTKIRRAMTTQCNASTECHWMQIAHTSKDNNIADFLSIYRRAKFCLCPPGDDPARKAVFDAILSGCIPVIFEVATLFNQYPWHIGEQAALDIAVSFPGGLVRAGKIDFMSILSKIPDTTIRLKQQAIARLAPRLQYAMPPPDLLKNRSDETPWDPPFPDGVEVILDGLFLRTALAVKNASTGIPPRLQTNREWSQEYDVVKIKVPGTDSRAEAAGGGGGVGAGGRPGGHGGGGSGKGHHRNTRDKGGVGGGGGGGGGGSGRPAKPEASLGPPNEDGS